MNAKISVFVICVEAIIYSLLYDLHDCTFKEPKYLVFWSSLLLLRCFNCKEKTKITSARTRGQRNAMTNVYTYGDPNPW